MLVMVSASVFAAGASARGKDAFATQIAAGPVGLSCAVKGPTAGRVRVGAQVGYSDVRAALERRLAGQRGRGSLALTLLTSRGRVLARTAERDAVGLGHVGNRVHHTHALLLGPKASRRVLRYAHGKGRCGAAPERDRRIKVVIDARQSIRGPGGGKGSSLRTARLRGSARVSSQPGNQVTYCPPYACYKTGAEVLSWSEEDVRPFDMASVPLAERVAVPGPRMLVGLDNGPWAYWSDSDLNAQGSARTGNVYNFSHWQYADSLYYYAHYLLSVPPTVWVNAAHRNGVSVLGSVTGDCDECGQGMNELFEEHGPEAVDRLYRLAAAYGFDGWMIDVEAGAQYTPQLIAAMEGLKSRILPSGRPVKVVTYEAFQPSLNDSLLKPFEAAGEWQADYDHSKEASPYPQETFDFLGRQSPPLTDRRYDTYWATDVYRPYGENPPSACNRQSSANFIWNGFACSDVRSLFADLGSARAGADPPGFLQSMALYAPAWMMFGGRDSTAEPPAPRSVFQAAENRFWSGVGDYQATGGTCRPTIPGQNAVSSLLGPHSPLTRVPFFTRFNAGEGDAFVVEGRTAAGNWNLLAAEDALPSVFCSETRELGAAIDYGTAFDGGSSLAVEGRATPSGQRVYLYEARAQLPAQPGFVLRYLTAGQGPEPRIAVWIDGTGPIDLVPKVRRAEGAWTYTQAALPPSLAPGTLTRIGVGFGAIGPAVVKARIGELAVVDLATYKQPAQISPAVTAAQLTWTDPSPASTQYYNVWAVARGASCARFVGRALLRRYDLVHPLFPVPAEVQRFMVQPVSTSGLPSPLSPSPC